MRFRSRVGTEKAWIVPEATKSSCGPDARRRDALAAGHMTGRHVATLRRSHRERGGWSREETFERFRHCLQPKILDADAVGAASPLLRLELRSAGKQLRLPLVPARADMKGARGENFAGGFTCGQRAGNVRAACGQHAGSVRAACGQHAGSMRLRAAAGTRGDCAGLGAAHTTSFGDGSHPFRFEKRRLTSSLPPLSLTPPPSGTA